MDVLITNISGLLHIDNKNRPWKRGSELSEFPVTEDAWLWLNNGKIKDWGSMQNVLPEIEAANTIDAKGGMVLPTFADSHTHMIYAGTREDEFAKRLAGKSYKEIAEEGGGILNSARKLREASEDELYDAAAQRIHEVIKMGTGAIEIKSGYGLTTESEIKMLRVAHKLSQQFPVPIKKTFLGAHAFPEKFKNDHKAYVNLIVDEMLPEIASQNLADYVDVFCEEGYFSVDEMVTILAASKKYNLKAKLHLNQFNVLGSIEKAIEYDALSVDHLEHLGGVHKDESGSFSYDKNEAKLLGESDTIATLLPGCSLFLEIPFSPARDLINENAIVALATDYNPGSAPSGNMALMISLGCIKMKMRPEEAITAATLNGAAAMEVSDITGSVEKGKLANLIITRPINSYHFLPYNFGHNHIAKVLINGEIYS